MGMINERNAGRNPGIKLEWGKIMIRIAKVLPFFIIEWYAKKYCEKQKQHHGGVFYKRFVEPFTGVEITLVKK